MCVCVCGGGGVGERELQQLTRSRHSINFVESWHLPPGTHRSVRGR